VRHVIPFAFLFALPVPALAADPPKVEEFAPHAAGVALVEVTAVEKYDQRPVDGNAGVKFKLKLVRGSGEFVGTVHVVTAFGGLRPPGVVPKPSAPLKADSLTKGERYWIAFSSRHEYEKYNQGVIGFWPEKDAKAEALEAAVKADTYKWHPQYDPKLKLAIGRVIEKDTWRVRGEKDGKVIWEKQLPGKPTEAYFYGLFQSTGGDLDVKMPKCGQILFTETDTKLEADNEFGLPAGRYYVNNGLDPETGKKHGTWVRVAQAGHIAVMNREYDPDTGKPTRDQRFDGIDTGGKALGAKTESWLRRTDRTFDPTGKVTKEEVFWYDASADAGKRWVKVK
jgi:hypothetical protein